MRICHPVNVEIGSRWNATGGDFAQNESQFGCKRLDNCDLDTSVCRPANSIRQSTCIRFDVTRLTPLR